MYGCESWTIKKAEYRRIDAFGLWCWRRLLRVPWIARRSNQFILKEISPEYSLEGLMLKLMSNTLATWCKKLSHWKRPWCWERLRAGGGGDDRGWDGWMASLTWWTYCAVLSHSVVSNSLRPNGLWPTRLLCLLGILQARILEWVAMPYFMGSSQARDQTQVSCIAGRFFTSWATREFV